MSQFPQHQTRERKCSSPKMVPLREEFISLTNDPLIAIVLNQLLYWTQRVKDFDLLLEEERFYNPDCNAIPRHGWIYKTANDLIIETMTRVDRTTMRRYLKTLISEGWLEERSNPQNRWDKTSQYRLNLRKLQEDLWNLGFELPGVHLLIRKEFIRQEAEENLLEEENSDLNERAESSNGHNTPSNGALLGEQIAPSSDSELQHSPSREDGSLPKEQNAPSEGSNSPSLFTETTHKNTNTDYQQRLHARENFSNLEKSDLENLDLGNPNFENPENSELKDFSTRSVALDKSVSDRSVPDKSAPDKSVAEEMVTLWERHVIQNLSPDRVEAGNRKFPLIEQQKDQLESLFAFHFQNDMRLWERFCLKVKGTPFLMGGGPNGWVATLDWMLRDGSVLKVLEDKYRGSNRSEQQDSGEWKLEKIQSCPVKDTEKAAIIASIKDPLWKMWCTRLAVGVRYNEFKMLHEPLSALQLQQITDAYFIECEDERLVWVGSHDQNVLNKIEDLRLKIIWVFKGEYPKASTFRTRLEANPRFREGTSHE